MTKIYFMIKVYTHFMVNKPQNLYHFDHPVYSIQAGLTKAIQEKYRTYFTLLGLPVILLAFVFLKEMLVSCIIRENVGGEGMEVKKK